jgi:5-(carboxyamino)imidazole ribonucleotide synthase
MPEFPLSPGSTIAILGGGQLGRMLCLAAARLGFDTLVLSPEPDSIAGRVATHNLVADYHDPQALEAVSAMACLATFEFENVPAAVVEALEQLGVVAAPGALALATAQDRVVEKTFLNDCGAPTVAFAAVDSLDGLREALDAIGAPSLLKTRREGYDGKGQTWVESHADAAAAWDRIGRAPAILEAPADFTRELSVIAARSRDGDVVSYPVGENHHKDGILRRTRAPANLSKRAREQAETLAARILTRLDYVGVMGVELFELKGGKLLVNEFAPRVHNSGHWTLDGCEVDQFEQHIRAITGWPLGPTKPLALVEMENLIGEEIDDWLRLAAEPEARLWYYGKAEARPGRKMGHVNRLWPLKD